MVCREEKKREGEKGGFIWYVCHTVRTNNMHTSAFPPMHTPLDAPTSSSKWAFTAGSSKREGYSNKAKRQSETRRRVARRAVFGWVQRWTCIFR